MDAQTAWKILLYYQRSYSGRQCSIERQCRPRSNPFLASDKKPLADARGSWGNRRNRSSAVDLLFRRRLLLTLRRCVRRAGSQLIQVVLQEADFHATTGRALGLAVARRGSLHRSIAHPDEVDA